MGVVAVVVFIFAVVVVVVLSVAVVGIGVVSWAVSGNEDFEIRRRVRILI